MAPAKRKAPVAKKAATPATTKVDEPVNTDLIPPGDVEPDPYVEDPDYDEANDKVDVTKVGDPHPALGDKP